MPLPTSWTVHDLRLPPDDDKTRANMCAVPSAQYCRRPPPCRLPIPRTITHDIQAGTHHPSDDCHAHKSLWQEPRKLCLARVWPTVCKGSPRQVCRWYLVEPQREPRIFVWCIKLRQLYIIASCCAGLCAEPGCGPGAWGNSSGIHPSHDPLS